MGNMPKSCLEREKESHVVLVGNSKQQEDLEMYIQLPDYEEFQLYDLGVDAVLSQTTRKIYGNFHKPSRQTLKRHFLLWNSQEIVSVSRNYSRKGEKEYSKQERMFGMVAKIPIANTFNELVEMDFVDYGDYSAFLRIQDTFFAILRSSIYGGKEKDKNGGRGPRSGDFALVIGVWAPGVIVVGEDMGFIGTAPMNFAQLVISRYRP